jgi:DNA replication protein DnaC
MSDEFKKIESSLVLSGIPPSHKDSHLYNFENKYDGVKTGRGDFWRSLVQTATLLLKDPSKLPNFIFLCGQPGNGKTHFLVGLYRALVHQMGYTMGDGASFYTYAALAQEIIAGFSDNIPIRTAMTSYTQAKFLFIDDFTATTRIHKVDSLEFTVFKDIILDRHERGYHLIASSNIRSVDFVAEFDKLFGEHVTSRIAGAKLIQFPDIDLRKVK